MASNVVGLLLAHHPICEQYKHDLIGIRIPLCRGCTVFYPSLLITGLLIGLLPSWQSWFKMYFFIVFFLGFFGISTYFFKLLFRNISSAVDDLIHIFTGVGVSLTLGAIFLNPVPIFIKIIIPMEIQFALGFAAYLRIPRIDRICKKCPYRSLGKKCPGFTQKSLRPTKISIEHGDQNVS